MEAHLSEEMLEWIRNKVLMGLKAPEIHKQHVLHLHLSGKLESGETLTRDDCLKPQDIRNQMARLGGELWRLSSNQGAGVHVQQPTIICL
jgi:hypothetical protein